MTADPPTLFSIPVPPCGFALIAHNCGAIATHEVWGDVGQRWTPACATAAALFRGRTQTRKIQP